MDDESDVERVALVGAVGFAFLFHIDQEVAEVASFLNGFEVGAGVVLVEILLGAGQVVGELKLLFLSVENGDPLVFHAVSDDEFLAHSFVCFFDVVFILIVCFIDVLRVSCLFSCAKIVVFVLSYSPWVVFFRVNV